MAGEILFLITWKTIENRPLVDATMADHLVGMLPKLAQLENATVLELAVIPDHVHAVVRTEFRPDLPALVQRLKGASSRLINRDTAPKTPLKWQPGYHVTSMGRQSLPYVRNYLDRQARKHGYSWQRRYSVA
jgi:REP element-mobilizing transposase RayT